MLAGLLFATSETQDRPDQLIATLPFSGMTLIEYQARLLLSAGVSQIIIFIARLTPELLGAIARIRRPGLTVDLVRSASETCAKLHPLANIITVADGLVTTETIIGSLCRVTGDALLVVDAAGAQDSLERVGGDLAWAGLARLDPLRMAEAAELPADYDLQSTLLRLAEQAGAAHIALPRMAGESGHGIVDRAHTLQERGRAIIAALLAVRPNWFDRYLVAPIARTVLPLLLDRIVPTNTLAVLGIALGLAGVVTVSLGQYAIGTVAALIAVIVLGLGSVLADLRDQQMLMKRQRFAASGISLLLLMAIGWAEWRGSDDHAALVIAISATVACLLGERATRDHSRRVWWGSAPGYLMLATVPVIFGFPVTGLGIVATYSAITLAAAIEALQPQE